MLIFRDETTGGSFSYVETDAGYRQAAADIREREKLGHRLIGDIDAVKDYVQSSWRETGFIWKP